MKFSIIKALTLPILLGAAAFAQVNAARISGTVTDSSGLAVPGAKVVVKDEATRISWKVEAGGAGHYVCPELAGGNLHRGG